MHPFLLTRVGPVAFQRLDARHAVAMRELEQCRFSLPWSEAQCRAVAFEQLASAAFGLFGMDLLAYTSGILIP